MLKKENFTEEHIRELQKVSRRDPILLERTVYAFGLLEAIATFAIWLMFVPMRLIVNSGFPFCFILNNTHRAIS